MTAQTKTAVRVRFEGWPKPALQFFRGLKRDNSKAFFEAHRSVYEEQVRQPMEALLSELERDLGSDLEVKIFRLNRDLRFSPDKRPYKEHLGAYLSSSRAGGLYLQVSDDGLYVAIGTHEMAADQLTRFRDAVLLRCKGLMTGRNWKPGPWLQSAEAKERIQDAIKASKPLTGWLDAHVGPSRPPARPGR
ncbi:MAG: DUF2461 domain-containing protein [Chloroflexota bacterium]|nr:MAG: DUF2461 domain-containing protein [Chloroflexota bacterium]